LSEKNSFEELASKLATSRRNFDRRFIKATGNTPVEYRQRVKVEAAKRTLEKGRKSIFEVSDNANIAEIHSGQIQFVAKSIQLNRSVSQNNY